MIQLTTHVLSQDAGDCLASCDITLVSCKPTLGRVGKPRKAYTDVLLSDIQSISHPYQVCLASSDLLHMHLALAGTRFVCYYYCCYYEASIRVKTCGHAAVAVCKLQLELGCHGFRVDPKP